MLDETLKINQHLKVHLLADACEESASCAGTSKDFCGCRGVRSHGHFLCKEESIMGKLQKRKGIRGGGGGENNVKSDMPDYLCRD